MKQFKLLFLFLVIGVFVLSCKKTETDAANDTSVTTASSDTAMSSTTGTSATGTTTTGTATTVSLNDTDKDFVTSVGKAGTAEVDLANDALAHASNTEVKAFAQRLVDDHTRANQELTQLAAGKGVTMPSEVQGGLKELKERLMKLTGKSFDEAFVKQMVEDHDSTVKKFEEESAKATDTDLKAWVVKTLPALKDHLKMARDLQTKVSKEK